MVSQDMISPDIGPFPEDVLMFQHFFTGFGWFWAIPGFTGPSLWAAGVVSQRHQRRPRPGDGAGGHRDVEVAETGARLGGRSGRRWLVVPRMALGGEVIFCWLITRKITL